MIKGGKQLRETLQKNKFSVGVYSLDLYNRKSHKDISQTIDCGNHNSQRILEMEEIEKYRIRKLTPKETWRLQGFSPRVRNKEGNLVFDDSVFEKAKSVNSDSQLYKQAGNSITVDVLCSIFKKVLGDADENKKL